MTRKFKASDVASPERPPSVASKDGLPVRTPAHKLQLPVEDCTEYHPRDGRRWAPRSTLLLAGGISLLAWVIGALAVTAIR